MTQRMSQSPDPATPGGEVEIDYDTSGVTFPFNLVVYGAPCGSREVFPIASAADLPIKVKVPTGCTGGTVEDGNGQSDAFPIAVAP